jgi:hypothetical protein
MTDPKTDVADRLPEELIRQVAADIRRFEPFDGSADTLVDCAREIESLRASRDVAFNEVVEGLEARVNSLRRYMDVDVPAMMVKLDDVRAAIASLKRGEKK